MKAVPEERSSVLLRRYVLSQDRTSKDLVVLLSPQGIHSHIKYHLDSVGLRGFLIGLLSIHVTMVQLVYLTELDVSSCKSIAFLTEAGVHDAQ